MKTLQIELPSEMDSEFKALGLTDDPGIAAWIANAIQEKLSATKQLSYLESRASRGSRDEFQGSGQSPGRGTCNRRSLVIGSFGRFVRLLQPMPFHSA